MKPRNASCLRLLCMFCTLLVVTLAQAQQVDISLNVGLLPPFFKDGARQMRPLSGSYVDVRFNEKILAGVGVHTSLTLATPTALINDQNVEYLNHQIIYTLRFGAMTSKFARLNVYGGMSIHLSRTRLEFLKGNAQDFFDYYDLGPKNNELFVGAFVGGRYHINDYLAIMLEGGTGGSLVKTGLTFTIGSGPYKKADKIAKR